MKLNYIKISSLILLLAVSAPTLAQSSDNPQLLYTEAQTYYNNGKFDEAEQLLLNVTHNNDRMLRSGAFRLLALCYIERGDLNVANDYVKLLLNNDPYYTASYTDNRNFIDLLERNKHHGATITTASQQAETIEEAPVPVTLITEEMLQNIGARTLKEALIAYVPGMTDIASNDEMNIAMRGIYSSGQETILILLNGHRLNSYSTNAATPDFGISLEKVKQIEVLRGPASSIYGGVALTGVVNIITKNGSDVDGFKVKGSIGNYGQKQGDLLFGKSYMNLDVLAWASIYTAEGEKYSLTEENQPYALAPNSGDALLGTYNKKPTYNIGFSINHEGLSALYNRSFVKTVYPMTLSIGFTPYSYDKYRKWNGNSPGNAILSQHAELRYEKNYGNFSWNALAYFDSQDQQRYQVTGDYVPEIGFNDVIIYETNGAIVKLYDGCFQGVKWDEHTLGAKVQSSYKYRFGNQQEGNILVGGEYSKFTLNDSHYVEGLNYYRIVKTYDDEKILLAGEETNADAFVQLKHKFGKKITLNAGIRYDYKERRTGKTLHELSPRTSLIYNHTKFNIKLSYSKAFVDAPYFYRNNTLDVNYGDESMEPEFLNSFQLSFFSDGKIVKNLLLDVNAFYNKATNFIVSSDWGNTNAGRLESVGLDIVARYNYNRLSTEANITWQKVVASELYAVDGSRIFNIPSFQANLIASYKILDCIKVHVNGIYTSEQSCQYIDLENNPHILEVPSRIIFNAGATYTYNNLEVSANFYNATNKKYEQGGTTIAPFRQQSRWVLGSVAYKF